MVWIIYINLGYFGAYTQLMDVIINVNENNSNASNECVIQRGREWERENKRVKRVKVFYAISFNQANNPFVHT